MQMSGKFHASMSQCRTGLGDEEDPVGFKMDWTHLQVTDSCHDTSPKLEKYEVFSYE